MRRQHPQSASANSIRKQNLYCEHPGVRMLFAGAKSALTIIFVKIYSHFKFPIFRIATIVAKWSEGDPRCLVEERTDGRNVNNWHWVEKNATPWSENCLKKLFIDRG
uniref:Uncharacterized protein n=1 Tax=Ditylenchus dipsaci TaxID=166011 RepID=A0A915CY24_9BILA